MAVLGGRAHLNGITFATSTYIVRGKLKNGVVTVHVQKLPQSRLLAAMDNVPVVRGISRLIKLNWRLLPFLFLLLAVPWDRLFPDNPAYTAKATGSMFAIYGAVLIALIFLLKRLWQFHGAEHKAFNVYTEGAPLLPGLVQRAERVSSRCGTNLVVIVLPIAFLLSNALYQIPLFMDCVSLSVGYEIFKWSSRRQRLRVVYRIGAFIQKYIVTKEPGEDQIRVAIATLSKAIDLDRECAVQ